MSTTRTIEPEGDATAGAEADTHEAIAYTRYEWDCPVCSEVNEVDHDPQSETVSCGDCRTTVLIRETR
ncbi:hypothetical protein OVA26_16170 [Microbacterium sp. SL62]|uniref:hypothetical protein n=1 Tax=Microbacterium sp. SL62 TaxID=2995139 RepID=UPI0022757678|nr:hypothetical protein [Microbacterium sp. SL62]MCY1718472.1 hypothetical protein [Microbacterium sp. SL62]